MAEFILYSRTYCHLCDEMLAALQALCAANFSPCSVKVVDVDADAMLVEQYDELVPVLIGLHAGKETRLCHYFLDETRIKTFLQETGAGAG